MRNDCEGVDAWGSDDWCSPPEVFFPLQAEIGTFLLDPCSNAGSLVVAHHCWHAHGRLHDSAIARQCSAVDGLSRPWPIDGGWAWVNPPYSDPAPWVRKAISESATRDHGAVAMLLPSSTGERWFHALVIGHARSIVFIGSDLNSGRLKFVDPATGRRRHAAKGGSVLALFTRSDRCEAEFRRATSGSGFGWTAR